MDTKPRTGFDSSALDDWGLVEALASVDGMALAQAVKTLYPGSAHASLLDELRRGDGRVPISDVMRALRHDIEAANRNFLLLLDALSDHRAALTASIRAEYHVGLREVGPVELADMVAWLPPGCALWRSVGGPMAISLEVRELRRVGYWLRVLDYRERGSKGEKPKPDPEPELAGKARVEESHAERQAAAYRRRQARR